MANKAVLNIKNFSLGKSSSMASLVIPTTVLEQDVRPYDVLGDITSINDITQAINTQGNSGNKTADAIYKFLKVISSREDQEWIRDIQDYRVRYPLFHYYSFVHDKVKAVEHLLESVEIEEPGSTQAALRARIEATVTEVYQTIPEDLIVNVPAGDEVIQLSENDITILNDKVNAAITSIYSVLPEKDLPIYDDDNETEIGRGIPVTEDFVDTNILKLEEIITFIEYGEGDPLEYKKDCRPVPFRVFQNSVNSIEVNGINFYFVLRCIILSQSDKLSQSFENLRLVYNRKLIEEYRGKSVEFPYFLDLGFKTVTKELMSDDADGKYMHSLEREYVDNDNWVQNANYGDRLKIRDMFRIDKLNKKSAFESSALYPGVKGAALDKCMEEEDVVTRLAQNDWDLTGIIGSTITTEGMYFLTDDSDSVASSVRSTRFNDIDGTLNTSTFRNFTKETEDAHYLTTAAIPSTVSLQRRYGDKNPAYSSGNEFLKWYKDHHNSVVIYPSSIYSEGSLLKIVGKNSYEFYPSEDGILGIKDVYDANNLPETLEEIPTKYVGNFVLKACIGDDNYIPEVARRVTIEVPCNTNSQYSYVTFTVQTFQDPNLGSVTTDDREMKISLSLDDEVGIVFDLLHPEKTNIKENEQSSLFYSLQGFKPNISKPNEVVLMIENDLENGRARSLHIDVISNYPSKSSTMSESLLAAYNNTYIGITNPQISITNVTNVITYGNYHEYRKSENKSVLDYWNLSRSIQNTPYQYLLEVPQSISLGMDDSLSNNYQTADLYSDIITLKSQMDSEYRMQTAQDGNGFILDRFRKYTGIDSCSNTISLYYDSDLNLKSKQISTVDNPNIAVEYSVADTTNTEHEHSKILRYKRIETIKAINRFTESIKHKSNLYSVEVTNTRLSDIDALPDTDKNENIKKLGTQMRRTIEMMVRNICDEYAPVHNQLFKVYVS